MRQFDFIVIGSGPGGTAAARMAAKHQARVALIEKGALGGVSLHHGCISIKSLVVSSKMQHHAIHGEDYGLDLTVGPALLPRWMTRQREVVAKLSQDLDQRLNKAGITLIEGAASFVDPFTVEVQSKWGTEQLTARKFIISSGALPVPLPGLPPENQVFNYSDHYLHRTTVPDELLVIGGGYIACELASIYRMLGANITMVEAHPTLLPDIETEAGEYLVKRFRTLGMDVRTGTRVEKAELIEDGQAGMVTLDNGEILRSQSVLVAVGRRPQIATLELAKAEIVHGESIEVNDSMQTSQPHIYAVGDCNNRAALAHAAKAEARVATAHALGESRTMDYGHVPFCVYTIPEITTVGLNQADAEAKGHRTLTGRCSFRRVGRAVALGELEGFLKLIADVDTHRILGGLVICLEASELVAQLSLAIKFQATLEQIADLPFPHPTLSEALQEAANNALEGG
ncbi:MAG: NAD(P)/FAD-dependent oxidoreductase [Verrucomicrobiota bacterium]